MAVTSPPQPVALANANPTKLAPTASTRHPTVPPLSLRSNSLTSASLLPSLNNVQDTAGPNEDRKERARRLAQDKSPVNPRGQPLTPRRLGPRSPRELATPGPSGAVLNGGPEDF